MIQLSGRFLKYNIIDKNGVQFPKSATIKIPSKVFVLFNFDKSHPIGIAEVIKDEEGLLAGIDDVLGVLKDDKVGCGGYYRAVKSHMEYGIKKIVLKMATHYHANLIDIHNALHALGLKSDEQAEEFNKKHMMKIVDMYTRRGYDITK